jgi:cold shock CspA family protein
VATGKIKIIVREQFAFIRQDANGAKDVFVHFADFERAGLPRPEVDERYSFEIEETERGLRATNIAALD